MENILSNFISNVLLVYGVKIIGAIVLIVVGFAIVNWIKKKLQKGKLLKNLDATVSSFLITFISVALKVLLVLTAIIIIGVPSATVVAVLGSCGLAVGLALQGGLSNLAGGVVILLLKPFKLGDYISAAGNDGTVENIGIFSTTLLTVDNKRVVIPNGTISGGIIVNYSSQDTRRVDLSFTVAAGSDLDKIRKIFEEIAAADNRVLTDPAPDILVSELSAAGVTFVFRPWCKTDDYWPLYFSINEAVRRAFTEHNVQPPVSAFAVRSESK